jgi:hypothetical protein
MPQFFRRFVPTHLPQLLAAAFPAIPRLFRLGRPVLRRLPRLALPAAAALILGACTPSFDWRNVVNDAGGFSVMFPAKPGLDQRNAKIAGQSLPMLMQSARVGDTSFAVGVVTLPTDDPALAAAVLNALKTGLAHNINIAPATHPVQIDVGTPGQQVPGAEFVASGTVADAHHEHRVMHARFAVRGAKVYEAVIVAPVEPAAEQVDQFFGSLRLY